MMSLKRGMVSTIERERARVLSSYMANELVIDGKTSTPSSVFQGDQMHRIHFWPQILLPHPRIRECGVISGSTSAYPVTNSIQCDPIRSDGENMSNDVVVARSALLAVLSLSVRANGTQDTARQWEVSIAPCMLTLHKTYSPSHSLLGQKVSRIFLPRRFLLRSNQTRSVVEFRASSH